MNLNNILLYYVVPIVTAFGVAFLLHWFSLPLARWVVPVGKLTQRIGEGRTSSEARRQTLVNLVSALISVIAFGVAAFVSMAQFTTVDTLVWMIGLFGAGFGFSAKPFISDYMTGITFVADDPFDVGEKVEFRTSTDGHPVEGVVERITLRMTTLRGTNGEVYTVPNGEIRVIRNFSRGRYTPIKAVITVRAADLERTVTLLESLAPSSMEHLPNLIEPWRVVAEDGKVGQHAALTVAAKTAFGRGAETRPRLLALVQSQLEKADIPLDD